MIMEVNSGRGQQPMVWRMISIFGIFYHAALTEGALASWHFWDDRSNDASVCITYHRHQQHQEPSTSRTTYVFGVLVSSPE